MSLLVKELLQMSERMLASSHCLDYKIDAEMLFCHFLSIDKTQLFLRKSTTLDEKNCQEFFELIETRCTGMPTQYIIGSQEFMGLPFKVNENVLIPRQDTETLVEKIILDVREEREEKRLKSRKKILDLCCGSGAIGISLAKILPETNVLAVDISGKALEVAKENANKNRVQNNVKFLESNLFDEIKTGLLGNKFDIIVSNPPYIPTQNIPILQREVKEYEPMLALDGGADGLDFYRTIVEKAHEFLKKKGTLYLEIGYDQAEDLKKMMKDSGKYEQIEIMKDLAGLDRIVKCKKVLA